uniref:AIG1-type G domain-containing protein n=1 Tax=Lates calcarifer TaxID=8187 RepID=A0A4W6CVY8_LATCA
MLFLSQTCPLENRLCELRVVLLGNSWSQRSSVGNFILGETVFNTEEEADCCQRVRGQVEEKEIVLINTPDLLLPDISEHKLTEHVKHCVRLCDPGPHVFLLVLQPEDFTEEQKKRLCRVLQLFSNQSFDRSLVLISTPREKRTSLIENYEHHPAFGDMIGKCRRWLLWQKHEGSDLLTIMDQIVKENNGDHVICDVFMDTTFDISSGFGSLRQAEAARVHLDPSGAFLMAPFVSYWPSLSVIQDAYSATFSVCSGVLKKSARNCYIACISSY